MKTRTLFMMILTAMLTVSRSASAQGGLGWLHFGERTTFYYDEKATTIPVTVKGRTYQAYPVTGLTGVYYVPNEKDFGTGDEGLKILYLKNATLNHNIRCTKSTKELWVVVSGNCSVTYSLGSAFKLEKGNLSVFGESGPTKDFLTITQRGKYHCAYTDNGDMTFKNLTLDARGYDDYASLDVERSNYMMHFYNCNVTCSTPIYSAGGVNLVDCSFADNSMGWDASNKYVSVNGTKATNISINSKYGAGAGKSSAASSKWDKKTLPNGNVVFSNGKESFTMIRVTHGTFTMGGNNPNDKYVAKNEQPAHQVTIKNTYYISETEVTQAVWRAVMNEDPTFPGVHLNESVAPVLNATYQKAVQFTQKLSALTGEEFSLPTEAQWEFAARGGIKSKGYIYSGSDKSHEVAWSKYTSNVGASAQPHAVKNKQPNELGIYDMSGNAYEWCRDSYKSYTSRAETDPCATGGSQYVRRGGSCYSDLEYIRISSRQGCNPETGNGVRIVMKLSIDLL